MKRKSKDEAAVYKIINDFIRQRKNQMAYWSALRRFKNYVGADNVALSLIQADESVAWNYKKHLTENYASATAAQNITIIKTVMRTLCDSRALSQNPFAILRTPKSTENRARWNRALEADEVVKLLEAIDRQSTIPSVRDAALFRIMFGHALRINEALSLKVRDFDGKSLVISNTKEKSTIRRDLSPDQKNALLKWLEVRGIGAGYLFCSANQYKVRPDQRVAPGTINGRIRGYCEELGILGFTSHSARVTGITRALEMGYSYEDVAAYSRHGSIKMVEAYDRRERRVVVVEYSNKRKSDG